MKQLLARRKPVSQVERVCMIDENQDSEQTLDLMTYCTARTLPDQSSFVSSHRRSGLGPAASPVVPDAVSGVPELGDRS